MVGLLQLEFMNMFWLKGKVLQNLANVIVTAKG